MFDFLSIRVRVIDRFNCIDLKVYLTLELKPLRDQNTNLIYQSIEFSRGLSEGF